MGNTIKILEHLQFYCPTAQQKSALLGLSSFVRS
jgi:hypothetical protein